MSEFDDALDEFAGDLDDEGENGQDDASTRGDDGFLGATPDELAALAERPGPMQDIARELVAIREERRLKVQAENARKFAQSASASDLELLTLRGGELDAAIEADPEVRDRIMALRAGVEAEIAANDETAKAHFSETRLNERKEQHFDDATITRMAQNDQADMAQVDEFLARGGPRQSAMYREAEALKFARDRERAAADGSVGSILEAAAEAEAYVANVRAQARRR